MDFREAKIGMEILGRYECGELRDWGSEENRKLPIDGTFGFAHDICYVSLPRTTDNPDLTDEERQMLLDANWMFDEKNQCWSHF